MMKQGAHARMNLYPLLVRLANLKRATDGRSHFRRSPPSAVDNLFSFMIHKISLEVLA
jgi:hypothetical protein